MPPNGVRANDGCEVFRATVHGEQRDSQGGDGSDWLSCEVVDPLHDRMN